MPSPRFARISPAAAAAPGRMMGRKWLMPADLCTFATLIQSICFQAGSKTWLVISASLAPALLTMPVMVDSSNDGGKPWCAMGDRGQWPTAAYASWVDATAGGLSCGPGAAVGSRAGESIITPSLVEVATSMR